MKNSLLAVRTNNGKMVINWVKSRQLIKGEVKIEKKKQNKKCVKCFISAIAAVDVFFANLIWSSCKS